MLTLRSCVVGAVAVLLVSSVASAQTSADEVDRDRRQARAQIRAENKPLLDTYLAKANAGDASAQNQVGKFYAIGHDAGHRPPTRES
jgi:hypothetical protein